MANKLLNWPLSEAWLSERIGCFDVSANSPTCFSTVVSAGLVRMRFETKLWKKPDSPTGRIESVTLRTAGRCSTEWTTRTSMSDRLLVLYMIWYTLRMMGIGEACSVAWLLVLNVMADHFDCPILESKSNFLDNPRKPLWMNFQYSWIPVTRIVKGN